MSGGEPRQHAAKHTGEQGANDGNRTYDGLRLTRTAK
ncbi:MAG: hypothetical protein AzoDbin1_05349 [Azoarcus sp.]|nr:hypothetical protein [Azoarcus sp.]